MKKTSVLEVMTQIRDLLLHQGEIWTIDTFCTYTGFEKSYVYKMTSQKKIPHYKTPGGKTIIFKRVEIIDYMTSNRIKTRVELDMEAETVIKLNKRKTND